MKTKIKQLSLIEVFEVHKLIKHVVGLTGLDYWDVASNFVSVSKEKALKLYGMLYNRECPYTEDVQIVFSISAALEVNSYFKFYSLMTEASNGNH